MLFLFLNRLVGTDRSIHTRSINCNLQIPIEVHRNNMNDNNNNNNNIVISNQSPQEGDPLLCLGVNPDYIEMLIQNMPHDTSQRSMMMDDQ